MNLIYIENQSIFRVFKWGYKRQSVEEKAAVQFIEENVEKYNSLEKLKSDLEQHIGQLNATNTVKMSVKSNGRYMGSENPCGHALRVYHTRRANATITVATPIYTPDEADRYGKGEPNPYLI